jgi:hypothetical protein
MIIIIDFLLIEIPSSVPSPAVHRFIALFSIPESSATGTVAIETAAAAVPRCRNLLTRKLKENYHISAKCLVTFAKAIDFGSVADPGCLSRIRMFSIPDPGSGSKTLSILT